MKVLLIAAAGVCALACDAPRAVPEAAAPRTAALSAADDGITPPACDDIHFVSQCLPADCFHRKDTPGTHSLSRHALCPTLNDCASNVDIIAKIRTCGAEGCGTHALGFIRCYEPGNEGRDEE